ncbi:MAG: ribonuclease Y [Planctomycetes bacterium]|nr:ribonuclease Y [Planctomycetota bacterium]
MEPITIIVGVVGLGGGAAIGAAVYRSITKGKERNAQAEAEALISGAKAEATKLKMESELRVKEEGMRIREESKKAVDDGMREVKEYERRISKREDVVDRKAEQIERREKQIETKERGVADLEQKISARQAEVDGVLKEQKEVLQRLSGLSKDEATKMILEKLRGELKDEMAAMVIRAKDEAKETAEREARDIISIAVQRFAGGHTADTTVSTVDLPTDDMKGRIIGREGRNIRAFEKATGVDVIVDDTPGVVVISGFDGVRREMARRSLEKLVADGRIHPARIEEVIEATKKEMEEVVMNTGKQLCFELGFSDIHPKIVMLLGRLKYRTSYGQNNYQHVTEVAYLSQAMAAELGLDPTLARRCGLLHDIGKAVDHELEGGHPAIGADLLKRFGERPEVVDAAGKHHEEMNAAWPYTVVASAADAISAARPGARRETLEKYIKRLERLESIASGFQGVEASYAIQAGREVRVICNSAKIDDKAAVLLARDIAKEIEKERNYPGEIKVCVLRETRAVEFAR